MCLTKYRSLELYCNQIHIIFSSFDNISFEILNELKLENATVIYPNKSLKMRNYQLSSHLNLNRKVNSMERVHHCNY